MRVNICMHGETSRKEGETIEDIIETCGFTIESVILLKGNEVILEEDVADNDTIEVVPVASGG